LRHLVSAALLLLAGTAFAGGAPATKAAPRSKSAHAAVKAPARSRSFDFTRDIGIVEGGNKDSLWLMIADTTLAVGDSLTLISDDPDPDENTYVAIFSAAVAERLHRRPVAKMQAEAGDVFYRLVAPPGALDCCIFGYAVRAPREEIRIVKHRPEGDLDHDGTAEHFQSCATVGTLHPTVWSGDPLLGVRRWTRSYSVDYDLVPNCPGLDSSATR